MKPMLAFGGGVGSGTSAHPLFSFVLYFGGVVVVVLLLAWWLKSRDND
jgi:hypothetical protein